MAAPSNEPQQSLAAITKSVLSGDTLILRGPVVQHNALPRYARSARGRHTLPLAATPPHVAATLGSPGYSGLGSHVQGNMLDVC